MNKLLRISEKTVRRTPKILDEVVDKNSRAGQGYLSEKKRTNSISRFAS